MEIVSLFVLFLVVAKTKFGGTGTIITVIEEALVGQYFRGRVVTFTVAEVCYSYFTQCLNFLVFQRLLSVVDVEIGSPVPNL